MIHKVRLIVVPIKNIHGQDIGTNRMVCRKQRITKKNAVA